MSNENLFTFEHNGKTYTFEKDLAVVRSPRFLRAHRRRDEVDLTFTIIEEVAGEEALAAVDSMTTEEFDAFSVQVWSAISGGSAGLGESSRS